MKNIQGEVDGRQKKADVLLSVTELNPGHFIVTSDEETSEVFLTSTELLSDGNALDGVQVKVSTERERIIQERFANSLKNGSSSATKGMILKASMPGMVKAVSVSVGDKVQKGTQVLVLEAMKMENSITAGFNGIVSKIYVEPGVSVEKNMPLVEFRAAE